MAAHCFDATTFVGPCNHKARGQHHNPPAPGRSHYLKIKRKQVCNKFFIGMKRIHTILIILLLAVTYGEAKKSSDDRQMDDFITSLMKKMTLEEKIGQLNLGGVGSPKVVGSAIGLDEAIRKGLVSSVGGFDAKAAEDAQKFAVENSRMKMSFTDTIRFSPYPWPVHAAGTCPSWKRAHGSQPTKHPHSVSTGHSRLWSTSAATRDGGVLPKVQEKTPASAPA